MYNLPTELPKKKKKKRKFSIEIWIFWSDFRLSLAHCGAAPGEKMCRSPPPPPPPPR